MRNRVVLRTLTTLTLLSLSAAAQPVGWSNLESRKVTVGGTALTNEQFAITLDTQALIAGGKLKTDGSDLRIVTTCGSGGANRPIWIDPDTLNTTTTKVWTKGPYPVGDTDVFVVYGNPAASSVSDPYSIFDGSGILAPNKTHSATDQVASGGAGGVASSQRGFRFQPNEEVVVVQFGKREPTGTDRTVTLFNWTTQAKLRQGVVSGPAAQYSYSDISAIMLSPSTVYTLQLFQGPGDGYYFGTSSQINSRLTYLDMRYCNSCTADTFPTNTLSNYHYGYPDLAFLTLTKPAEPVVVSTSAGACTASASCDTDCSSATCGDGVLNTLAGEACDDGNGSNTDACTNACKVAACGDGFVQAGEECDDANGVNGDACTNSCKTAKCGDGIVQIGVDECDDANAVDTDACRNSCKQATCGDGVVYAGVEMCDDANAVDTDTCRNNCSTAMCGDGVVQAGVDECDDGNNVDTDSCTNKCATAKCGDGVVQAGVDVCDDGNNTDTDGCTNACKNATCGDGIVQAGVDDCDDGNKTDTDGCTNACKAATCGDGIVQAGVDDCDDGNKTDTDDCTNACKVAKCGDGIVQVGKEACDDSNTTNGDGCSSTCIKEVADAGVDASLLDASVDASKSDGSADASKLDASVDASTTEAGVDPTAEATGGGCGCRTSPTKSNVAGLASLLAMVALLRRRNRK